MTTFIVTVIWIACGVLAYGLVFAYFQREHSVITQEAYYSDRRFAIFTAILGPAGLTAVVILFGVKHGLKFK